MSRYFRFLLFDYLIDLRFLGWVDLTCFTFLRFYLNGDPALPVFGVLLSFLSWLTDFSALKGPSSLKWIYSTSLLSDYHAYLGTTG